ncbi:hypothetical protein L484_006737 [Morus notabilis]|uniref:Uncharacterized protein n=1 Tax=Morus notabilis TaxID=981085 RepID=W9S9J1_9ROSA|nr:hypothetical protein L484_006737 [Morus notabilis]
MDRFYSEKESADIDAVPLAQVHLETKLNIPQVLANAVSTDRKAKAEICKNIGEE